MLKAIVILSSAFYYSLPFFSLNSYVDAIIFGIPWQTLIMIYATIFFHDIHWHLWYLTLTCYYFKLKLSNLHKKIINCHSVKNALKMMEQLNLLHLKIHKSNSDFWCFYNTEFLCQSIFIINFLLYSGLFANAYFVFRFIMCYSAFGYFILFTIFLISPSLVTYEASTSYGVFLKIYNRLNQHRRFSILDNFRVRK